VKGDRGDSDGAALNLAQIHPPAQARAILERYLEFDPASAAVRKQLRAITRSGLPLP
jgi:hypothetical protein